LEAELAVLEAKLQAEKAALREKDDNLVFEKEWHESLAKQVKGLEAALEVENDKLSSMKEESETARAEAVKRVWELESALEGEHSKLDKEGKRVEEERKQREEASRKVSEMEAKLATEEEAWRQEEAKKREQLAQMEEEMQGYKQQCESLLAAMTNRRLIAGMERLRYIVFAWEAARLHRFILSWHVAQTRDKVEGRVQADSSARESIYIIKLREARHKGGIDYVNAIMQKWTVSGLLRCYRNWRGNQRDDAITSRLTEIHASALQVSMLQADRRWIAVSRLWKLIEHFQKQDLAGCISAWHLNSVDYTINEKSGQMEEYSAQVDELKQRVGELEAHVDGLQRDKEDLQRESGSLRQWQDDHNTASNEEVTKLRLDLEGSRDENGNLQQDLEAARAVADEESAAAGEELERVRRALEATHRDEMASLRADLEESRRQSEDAHAEEMSRLRVDLEDSQRAADNVQRDNESLRQSSQQQISASNDEVTRLRRELDESQREFENFKQVSVDGENEFRRDNEELKAEIERLHDQMRAKDEAAQILREQLNRAVNDLRAALERHDEEIRNVHRDNDQIDALIRQNNHLQADVHRLQGEIEQVKELEGQAKQAQDNLKRELGSERVDSWSVLKQVAEDVLEQNRELHTRATESEMQVQGSGSWDEWNPKLLLGLTNSPRKGQDLRTELRLELSMLIEESKKENDRLKIRVRQQEKEVTARKAVSDIQLELAYILESLQGQSIDIMQSCRSNDWPEELLFPAVTIAELCAEAAKKLPPLQVRLGEVFVTPRREKPDDSWALPTLSGVYSMVNAAVGAASPTSVAEPVKTAPDEAVAAGVAAALAAAGGSSVGGAHEMKKLRKHKETKVTDPAVAAALAAAAGAAGEEQTAHPHHALGATAPAEPATPRERSNTAGPTLGSEYGHLYQGWRDGPAPVSGKSGYLWKKAGGKAGTSPRRNNWNRRWFVLQGSKLEYYEDEAAERANPNPRGKSKPTWEGDIVEAQCETGGGTLMCETGWDDKSGRYVLSVSFGDRVLKIGTDKGISGEEKEARLRELKQWEFTICKHHAYHTRRNNPPPADHAVPASTTVSGGFGPAELGLETQGLTDWEVARRSEMIGELYRKFDANRDQKVGYDEFQALARVLEGDDFTQEVALAVYTAMDTDREGGISEKEFFAFVFKKTARMGNQAFDAVMKAMMQAAEEEQQEDAAAKPQTRGRGKSRERKRTKEKRPKDVDDAVAAALAAAAGAAGAEQISHPHQAPGADAPRDASAGDAPALSPRSLREELLANTHLMPESEYGHLYEMWRAGGEPNPKSGYLWKKAGGKAGSSPRRSNWNRRWFVLQGSKLEYYEDQASESNRTPSWEGDLSHANVDPETHTLECNVAFDEKSRRYVLSVRFEDRVLRIGTAKDIAEEDKEEQLKRLKQWEWSISRCDIYMQRSTQPLVALLALPESSAAHRTGLPCFHCRSGC